MLKVSRHIIFLVIICLNSQAISQHIGLDLLNGDDKKVIKFEYQNGFIIVPLFYGGILPVSFIFDTGSAHNILFKKSYNDILGFVYSDTISIKGADIMMDVDALVVRKVPVILQSGSAFKRDFIVLNKNFVDLEMSIGQKVDGVLGASVFRGLVVKINYQKKEITLYNPNKFKPPGKFDRFDIDIVNEKPYIKCLTSVEGEEATKSDSLIYLIDTGASLGLLIHENNSGFDMPENVILGAIGKGLGGEIPGYVGKIHELEFGRFKMRNVLTNFQDIDSTVIAKNRIARQGIIGNYVLSKFIVIIDYINQKLYLKQKSSFKEDTKYDKSGLVIYAVGEQFNEFIVKAVYPETPAREAGIIPGDKIIKIGIWPTKLWCTLPEINAKLSRKEGKKIKLTILRNGKNIKKQFFLRDPFKAIPK